jgi:hypothetical protein
MPFLFPATTSRAAGANVSPGLVFEAAAIYWLDQRAASGIRRHQETCDALRQVDDPRFAPRTASLCPAQHSSTGYPVPYVSRILKGPRRAECCASPTLWCASTAAETRLRCEQGGDARRVHGGGHNQDEHGDTQHEAIWLHTGLGQQRDSAALLSRHPSNRAVRRMVACILCIALFRRASCWRSF